MFNAPTDIFPHALKAFATIVAAAILTTCSSDSQGNDLIRQANEALDAGNYALALQLTDSVQVVAPTDAQARRIANHLHAKAMEGWLIGEIARTDSAIIACQDGADTISRTVRTISVPGLDPYMVGADAPEYKEGATGLFARLSPQGQITLISSYHQRIGHSSVTVSTTDGSSASTSQVLRDGELNRDTGTGEVVHYNSAAGADSVAQFITLHKGEQLKITFNGECSPIVNLTPREAAGIAQLTQYRQLYRKLQRLQLQHEKLDRELTVARNQVARTTPDKQ